MATKKTSQKPKKVIKKELPVEQETSKPAKKAELKKRTSLLVVIAILILVCLAVGIYYFLQSKRSQQMFNGPLLTTQMSQASLIEKIGQLIVLPTGEQPTIASVSDVTKLKGQLFFKNAKNGDVVLIYPKAGEAILYDPVANKIVQVGPVNRPQPITPKVSTSTNSAEAVAGAQTVAQPITVVLYNGTAIQGLAQKITEELKQSLSNISVIARTNALKQTYTQTTVVDLTGNQSAAVSQIAKVLNGTVDSLPAGEIAPKNAEVLVILGSGRSAVN